MRPAQDTLPEIREHGDGAASEHALTAYSVMWAVATLFHQVAYPADHVGASRYAVTFAALWLLLRPWSAPRLLLLAAVQAASVAYSFPHGVSNHWLFATLINAALLLAFVHTAAEGKSLRVRRGRLFEIFAPPARLSLIVLYFYAVFHKLNRDYLDPVVSCAVNHYRDIASAIPLLPMGTAMDYLAIGGSLAVELSIPILLCFRRTRLFGLLVGLSFHYLLGFNPSHTFYDFSSVIFAMYLLFTPFHFGAAIARLLNRTARGRSALARMTSGAAQRAVGGLVWAAILLLAAAYLLDLRPAASEGFIRGVRDLARAAWVLYGGTVLIVFLLVARNGSALYAAAAPIRFRPVYASMIVVPLLLVVNGASPYFGLKTESAFSMFSNLRTEGGTSNHLLVPSRVRLAGYQEDLVRVVSSSDQWLARSGDRGYLMTHFELRRAAEANPEMSVAYIRNGDLHVVPRAADDPELSRPLSIWQRQLLHFRLVQTGSGGIRCGH